LNTEVRPRAEVVETLLDRDSTTRLVGPPAEAILRMGERRRCFPLDVLTRVRLARTPMTTTHQHGGTSLSTSAHDPDRYARAPYHLQDPELGRSPN